MYIRNGENRDQNVETGYQGNNEIRKRPEIKVTSRRGYKYYECSIACVYAQAIDFPIGLPKRGRVIVDI